MTALDRTRVPPPLHDVLDLVEAWGQLDQDAQDRRLARLLREDPSGALVAAKRIEAHRQRLREWSSALWGGKTHKSDYTDEDWAHPYWAFLSTLTVFESVPGLHDDDPAVQAAIERMQAEHRAQRVATLKAEAADHFRDKEFARVVEALRSIEADLSPSERTKLALSLRKLADR